MTDTDRWYVNQNEGIDTLHRNPIERCNIDDADGMKTVDPKTAEAMRAGGHIRECKHCIREAPLT